MRTGAFAPPQRGLWPQWFRVLASLIPLIGFNLPIGPARAGGGEQPLSRQFTLHFDPQQVEIVPDEQSGYDRIRYPRLTDYQPPEWAGAPSLPALQREFLVPEGYRVADLVIQLTQPVLLPGDIHPYPIPDGSGGPAIPDPDYYDGGALFPPVTHRVTANGAYRAFRLARIVILPFEYLGSSAALRLYRQAEVTVRFEPVPPGEGLPLRLRPDRQLSRGRYEADWIRERVLNAEDFEGFYPEGDPRGKSVVTDSTHATGFHPTERPSVLGPPVDMVIVTGAEWTAGQELSGEMTVPFQRLADWRTRSGIPTVVRTVQWIRENYEGVDDPARIRSFLKDAYSKWGTDFALLGGSVEVVPARMMLTSDSPAPRFNAEDMPTDYYYSGLDGDWNANRDSYFDQGEVYDGEDEYPDLWVGRLPARDSLEAERIVDKIFTYERVPGFASETPDSTYYTKALLAAGLTNSGIWGNWNNGIYNAEMLWSEVLDSTGFAATRLYPCLDGSVDCGGATLACWYDTKAYFASYPPGDVLSGWEMRAHIFEDKPAILFHYEHSSHAHLGGPTTSGMFKDDVQPDVDNCGIDHPECADCAGWSSACWSAYLACNPTSGLSREVAMDLENGPHYFVGLSYGSHVGRFELDSVAEALVRAPEGGAVAFIAKSTSYTTVGSTTPETQLQIQAFTYLLEQAKPLAVALQHAILDQGGLGLPGSRVIWHCFGDPTLQVWNRAPLTLTATCSPTTLGLKGIKPFNITVNENGTPVEGARVTLIRDDDIFAVTESDASGLATFSSVLLTNVTDSVEVVCTLPNAAPVRTRIGPTPGRPGANQETPLVYRRHAYSDSARSGPTEGVIDAGDRVDLDIVVTNLGATTARAGTAWLVPTPRVKATALIDGEFDAEKVCIGRNKAHPPAFADTFCVLVNEYGIRPEGPSANMTTDSVWYLWRDELSRYHARAAYGLGDTGVPYDALFVADGGLSVVESKGTETGDDWGISADGDSLWIAFTGDGTDDELIWRAQAVDWITAVVDSVAYDSVRTNQSTTFSFRFDVAPDTPPRTRLDFTVAAQGAVDLYPAFTDFSLDLQASEVALGTVQDGVPDTLRSQQYACAQGDTLFALPFWLRNTGDGAADSLCCRVVLSGANVTVHVDTVWFNLDPGEAEGTNPFLFCDQGRTCAVDTLELARWMNGEKEVLELLTDLDPWPIGVADYLTGEPTTWPEPEGVRLIWAEPPETTGVWGYAVWVETDTIPERTMLVPRSDPRHVHLRELPHGDAAEPVAYRFGVATVLETRRETEPVWSWWAHPNLDERPGWPRKTPKGMANSVALVDLDDDGELEVVTAGRVLAAWKADGSSATTNDDGLLFDPDPTAHTVMRRQFYGEIAAGELFGIGEMGVVGAFGNDSLYAIEADGSLAWVKPLAARSGPTLADLDGDGELEVVIADFRGGKIHALRSDGSAYRGSTTEFAQPPDPGDYNPLGVAVGHWGEDDTLSIVQATTNGYIHCWRASTGWFSAPDKRRSWSYRVGTGLTSTPTVADFDRDGTQDVIFSTRQSAATSWVKVVDGADSAATLCSWQLPGLAINDSYPQVPVVLELGNGGYRDVLVGRRARKVDTYALDPATRAMILYQSGSSALQDSCEAEIPLPGRRGAVSSETIGSPVVADIDGDEKLEIMIGSNQGGLFVWEVEWNGQTQTWDSSPEPGWPIVLPDLLSSFALGDIDGDDFLELVIPMQDGYVHAYDLAGLSTGDEPWPMAGHDVRRTGNESGGGSGVPRQIPPALLPTDTGLSLAGRNPSAGEIAIRYRVPGRARVELQIYDIQGRMVRTLVPAGDQERGVYAEVWDGRTDAGHLASSGIYFVQARIGPTRLTKKVVLSR